ncbi:inositol polyphosphate 5-phosphatase K-like isoform X2 [Poecilia latipinna]|uniref:inositol polyphosphate 5-phosphatase K-like isoform X2 n=1 Tax=Poecilia latipinna TaxID=48699 RepID=UPI00072DFE43|nr:PREDICTED: inositol polyphosphate 5-phosphatase K-like isoform X2 [Poecilia latipinna]
MDEISGLLGTMGRVRSDTLSSDATQSTASKLALRHRLNQLMTCVDDLDPKTELHQKMVKTLDSAFLSCAKRANKPKKDNFRLHMVTWNVATADPPDDVASLLHLNSPKTPDLYVIGLQEVYSGPVRFVSDMIFDDPWSQLFISTLAPLNYIKVSSIRMQGLLLLFFSKLGHVPFIRDIQATYTRTGIFGYWGNKGGVSVRLSFYGHMLCFLNCHLAAHMKYANERMDEFEHIMDTQTFDCKKAPRIIDHRLVFWFGDLNFRIQDHGMHFVRSCINNQTYNLLWSHDQLIMLKKKEQLLQEFEEGPLDFQPTYKFDLNSDTYDSSGKKRKPAWTDRILWRVRPKSQPNDEQDENDVKEKKQLKEEEEYPLKVRQDLYTSNMEFRISDHKPVIGIFTLELTKIHQTPLVSLHAEGDWSADIDSIVLYNPLQPFPSSTWDWIGLYKVGFSSVSDYITYTWVKDDEVAFNNEMMQVFMGKEEIPVRGGECVLCYYSSNLRCIIGISEPFKVQESKVAVAEGLFPERINGLDRIARSEDF